MALRGQKKSSVELSQESHQKTNFDIKKIITLTYFLSSHFLIRFSLQGHLSFVKDKGFVKKSFVYFLIFFYLAFDLFYQESRKDLICDFLILFFLFFFENRWIIYTFFGNFLRMKCKYSCGLFTQKKTKSIKKKIFILFRFFKK